MADEFGKAHAEVIIRDFALLELGDQTPAALLSEGQEPRLIWLAICRAQQVPKERWTGLDKKAKKQHAE
jgi:hypothetical protein